MADQRFRQRACSGSQLKCRSCVGEVMNGSSGSASAARSRSCEWPESARPCPCHAFRRRSLHETHNGRSTLAAGTGPHAPIRSSPWLGRARSFGEEQSFVPRQWLAEVRHNWLYWRLHFWIGTSNRITFSGLINDLVGTGEDRRRGGKVERSRGIEIDD